MCPALNFDALFMSEALTNPYQPSLWPLLPSLAKTELWPSARAGRPQRLTLGFHILGAGETPVTKPEPLNGIVVHLACHDAFAILRTHRATRPDLASFCGQNLRGMPSESCVEGLLT
jgi:hypothetical protein